MQTQGEPVNSIQKDPDDPLPGPFLAAVGFTEVIMAPDTSGNVPESYCVLYTQ